MSCGLFDFVVLKMKILDTVASRHLGEMHRIPSWSGRAPKWASRIALGNERYAELLNSNFRRSLPTLVGRGFTCKVKKEMRCPCGIFRGLC